MTLRQLSSQIASDTQPGIFTGPQHRLKRFVGNRLRETGYGVFFASVFLMCQSPVNALSLNDIRVLSRLGEPLMAEVVVTPAAGEVLSRGCFSAVRSTGDLPDIGKVRLTLTRGINSSVLNIAGSQPMREPMTELMLQVKCPGVPTMVKNFLVMVDPPVLDNTMTTSASVSTPARAAAPATATSQSRRSGRPAPSLTSNTQAIQPGSQYTVRSGDMLSTIAARVSGRPDWSVWPIAQRIYATNPGAFLLGDPNVISQGTVIFIPRLADVDLRAPAAAVRPAGVAASDRPVPPFADLPAPPVVASAVTQAAPAAANPANPPANSPAPVAVAAPRPVPDVARIMPTPTTVALPAMQLPVMQLTTQLLTESRIKVMLRAQGSPVPSAVVARTPAAVDTSSGSTPKPQSEPDLPDSAATDTRAALQPGQPAQAESRLGWLWVVVGLLMGLMMGALAAVGVFRRNLRREYEHDVLEGVQRQVHSDRLRQQHDQMLADGTGASPTPEAVAATIDLSPTVEMTAASDHTVEMSTVDTLDFELSSQEETAKAVDPATVVMPAAASDLDLELPVDTGKTGQHEVDFDLLEAAYSDDYQNEFVSPGNPASDDQTTADAGETGDEAKRYYHLENRDPADETPLPIELGDDEMGSDDGADDGKVVHFRR